MKPKICIETGRTAYLFSTMVFDAKSKQETRRQAIKRCPWWAKLIGVSTGVLGFLALYAFIMWEPNLVNSLALAEPWERFFIVLFAVIFGFCGWVAVVASHENRGDL
ncbi:MULTISPECIES: hypothetical protein [Idiomarina]|uniref:hypothetical protein n=1 Tax=Idiomarina TaxID=135575 RepID=UPI00129AF7E8|nr:MULTISPECIES: hypothetical protein [Idiomarina]MRJ40789.1 hypothetical protein [Idiomarina sp. FeN1]NCU56593.1 hypothetical protein [Idiomarina sp. FenA--70]NCU58973.1 hypothetical protein [Idiomarina sp. FenBw--71]UUN14530.1 hypothetical protein KGF88_04765 [Idiomarina loihiensis]